MLEGERKRVLGIERLVLETMCFKFGVDVGLDLVVKIGSGLGGELAGFGRELMKQRVRTCASMLGASL